MIAVGIQLGGPEQRGALVDDVLTKAMNIAAERREANYDDGTQAWINPIFVVPGSITKLDFQGYKLGHFSLKRKGLVVMIAVPQVVADGDGVVDFIGKSLREAVRLGAAEFAEKGISFSTLRAEKIILAIEAGLGRRSVIRS